MRVAAPANVTIQQRPFRCPGCMSGMPMQIIFAIRFYMKLRMRLSARITAMTLSGGRKRGKLAAPPADATHCHFAAQNGKCAVQMTVLR
jgi:hypothetical protein